MSPPRASSGLAPSDVLRLAIAAALAKVHVGFPARVESYDADANTVDVQPQYDRATECLDGTTLHEELPIIPSVPIAWPRTRKYGVTFPIEVGDYVLILITDRSIHEWMRTGRRGDPLDLGTHELDGAVAIPGVYPSADSLSSPQLTDHLTIGALTTGGASIHIDANEIRIGTNDASDYVALASKVEAQLTRIKDAISNAATGSQDGGAALQAGIVAALTAPPFPESVGASKVKAT